MPIKLTHKEFISKCINKHNTQFTYSKTKYNGYDSVIIVTCNDHGDFEIKASTHSESKRGGCPYCKTRKKYTTNLFITEAIKIHNNKYCYDLVNIQTTNTATEKVTVLCNIHGGFETCADWHIKGKRGCQQCARERTTLAVTDTIDDFVRKAISTHGNELYDYSLVIINRQEKVKIICNRCKQLFEQNPNSHINGRGCRYCNLKGGIDETYFSKHPEMTSVPALLYMIKVFNDGEQFLKIGITTRTINERYTNLISYKYEIIKEEYMPLYDAFQLEQEYLRTNRNNRYWPKIKFDGWTECFILPSD